jgi:hypothetical protein
MTDDEIRHVALEVKHDIVTALTLLRADLGDITTAMRDGSAGRQHRCPDAGREVGKLQHAVQALASELNQREVVRRLADPGMNLQYATATLLVALSEVVLAQLKFRAIPTD